MTLPPLSSQMYGSWAQPSHTGAACFRTPSPAASVTLLPRGSRGLRTGHLGHRPQTRRFPFHTKLFNKNSSLQISHQQK